MPSKTLTLILGGARSGKSRYAQQLAVESGQRVLYVATAEAGDEEMAQHITDHRRSRPSNWETLEAPREAGAAVAALPRPYEVILLDCLTLLASNLIAPLSEPYGEAAAIAALQPEVDGLLKAYHAGPAAWIIVSNEVGLGLVPPYPLGRAYRDALGWANQRLAAQADEVILMVAGIPLKVKGQSSSISQSLI
jgi:adenosylcobinamide kinase / adenosylcobinamide-phosphate guanylyltransferase